MREYHDFDLTEFNGYRIQAKCRKAYFPDSESELINVFLENPKVNCLGSGHNIILSKEWYDSNFLILNGNFNNFSVENDTNVVQVEAGANMKDVSQFALNQKLSGLEFFFDIPSSLGGAVVMNAGTKEGETKDILIKVRYFDKEKRIIVEKNKEELDFDYRRSFFQNNKNAIILKAWFQLENGEPINIEKKMLESKERRWMIQPREYPNCGSVFKRPFGKFVGPMLDELSLRGYSIGGAQVSEKHSGFIINKGNATGSDIIELIKIIQQKVLDRFKVNLELEQRVI